MRFLGSSACSVGGSHGDYTVGAPSDGVMQTHRRLFGTGTTSTVGLTAERSVPSFFTDSNNDTVFPEQTV